MDAANHAADAAADHPANRRQHERFALPAAYTAVEVRRAGRKTFRLRGHAYDISRGGVRIELDTRLNSGEQVDLRVCLPGRPNKPLQATGHIVRFHHPADPGPAVMGVRFNHEITFA